MKILSMVLFVAIMSIGTVFAHDCKCKDIPTIYAPMPIDDGGPPPPPKKPKPRNVDEIPVLEG